MTSPSRRDSANASSPAIVSTIAVPRPSRRNQIAMQATPQIASTTPPSARDPDNSATPKPTISPVAAIGAVGRVLGTGIDGRAAKSNLVTVGVAVHHLTYTV